MKPSPSKLPLAWLAAALALFALTSCDELSPRRSVNAQNVGPLVDETYTLTPGDTLYSIAQRAYGNGLEWPRLLEANPWIDPEHLRPGQKVLIPKPAPEYDLGPQSQTRRVPEGYELAESAGSWEPQHYPPPEPGYPYGSDDTASTKPSLSTGNPGFGQPSSTPSDSPLSIFSNVASRLSESTLFGRSVNRLSFLLIIGSIIHAALQGFILWITTNITFVKDATFKKALNASFLTGMLTLCTIALFGIVGLMLTYAGGTDGAATGTEVLAAIEEFLQSGQGLAIAAFGTLLLYVLLSLRFIPQTFDIQRSQAFTVVVLGVVIPHLVVIFLYGRKTGLIA